MFEYALISGLTDSLLNGLSGMLDLLMRAGSDIIDLALDHPWFAILFVALLVLLSRLKARGGR